MPDAVTLDILAPSLPMLADTGDDVNENSIVTRLTYRAGARVFRELFMGDAGEASEARLLTAGADLRADALKVGHHGSRYASTASFIAAVQPKLAIISVGRHNTFGHPAPSTLHTFEAEAERSAGAPRESLDARARYWNDGRRRLAART